MKHIFKHICYDKDALLDKVNTLSKFISKVEAQSHENHGMGWTSDEYKGFAFEAFVEVLIKASPVDKRINITNYRPHSNREDGQDMGIDGYGMSHNGNLHTVQVKYRSNVVTDLNTKDMISNFVAKTTSSPRYRDADMTLFTTARGLNYKVAEDMYHSRVRTLGYNELSNLVDKNTAFWERFRKELS